MVTESVHAKADRSISRERCQSLLSSRIQVISTATTDIEGNRVVSHWGFTLEARLL